MSPDTRGGSAAQCASASEAFKAYSDLVQLHSQIPALWDEPERAQARTDAYLRFAELFEQ